jgi:hypothetical protein
MKDLSKSQHALLKAESYLKQMLDDLLEQEIDDSIVKQSKSVLKT